MSLQTLLRTFVSAAILQKLFYRPNQLQIAGTVKFSVLYCRFLEKDDAENTFITSTEGAHNPEVATEDDADKSIGKLKIMNYYNC